MPIDVSCEPRSTCWWSRIVSSRRPTRSRWPMTPTGGANSSSTEEGRMTTRAERKSLRHFGLIVGGIFGLIGLGPAVARGQGLRSWALGLALALVVPALVAPAVLAPAHRVWMALGDALGWVNTRI